MKKIITNLTRLHKSRISGAAQRDKSEILSRCSAPTAKKSKIFSLCPSIAVIYAALNVICIIPSNTSALSYSDNVGVNFTFDQSLTVSLSSADIVINNLVPGSASDSNVIDVNVLSNNLSGYTLTSTVGNNTRTNPSYDNTNLNHTSNSGDTFTSLSTSESISSLDDFNDNTWGYSYSLDNSTWSNYSGLPKYNDNTNVATLRTSTSPSSETGDDTYFKIAAKASTSQPSGEYRNVINFVVTAEHNPVSFYDAFKEAATKDPTISTLNGYYKMQDMSPSICESVELYDDDSHIQLIDTRDYEVYYIGKLKDNRCWLLDNLRLDPTIAVLSTSNTNAPQAALDIYQNGGAASESGWSGTKVANVTTNFQGSTGFYEPRVNSGHKNNASIPNYGTASGKAGVYYNYCAASAGTYCYDENSGNGDAEYDVCPIGWRMPTGGSDGEYLALYKKYNSTQIASGAKSLQHNLSTPLSGNYGQNGLDANHFGKDGRFWSSTYRESGRMSRLYITPSQVEPNSRNLRNDGEPMRCIANN